MKKNLTIAFVIIVLFQLMLPCKPLTTPVTIVTNFKSSCVHSQKIFHSKEITRQSSFLIPVDFNITYASDYVDSSWLNNEILRQFKYRVLLNITEPFDIPRQNYPVIFEVEFPTKPPGMCRDNTIFLTDKNGNPVPFDVIDKTIYTYEDTKYISKATIVTIVNISSRSYTCLYLYWSDTPVSNVPHIKGTLYLQDTYYMLNITNSIGRYKVIITQNGNVKIFFDNKKAFFDITPSIIPYMPQNGTYIILDSIDDVPVHLNSKDYDHLKVIAWEDNTHVIIYGFNDTTHEWDKLLDVILYKHQMISYPQEPKNDGVSQGYFVKYRLVKIVCDKPVSVISGDLGSSSTRNEWGVDNTTDDDVFSYYGFTFVGWIPRDLWISSYYNNTTVRIYDLSDADDNYEFTLDANEWWFVFGGVNSNTFDNDIVRIEATHPITIIGGFIDDDIFTLVQGDLMQKYIFPCLGYTGITALQNATKVNIIAINSSSGKVIYNKSYVLNAGEGISLNFTSNVTVAMDGDISLDEFVIIKITANNSITVTSEAGTSLASGDFLYTGTFFAFTLATNRTIRIFALYNSTTIKIYKNSTTQLYYTYSLNENNFLDYSLTSNSGFIITSNKPIVVKILGKNSYASEDISLNLALGKPVISRYEVLINSDCFIKVKVYWGTPTDLIVEDTYYFWSHARYFLLVRNISNPTTYDISKPMVLVDLLIPYMAQHQGIVFNDTNYVLTEKINATKFINLPVQAVPWSSTTGYIIIYFTQNLQFSYGITNFITSPSQEIPSLSGFSIYDSNSHFLVGWGSSLTISALLSIKIRSVFMGPQTNIDAYYNLARSVQLGKYLSIYVSGNGKTSSAIRFDIETPAKIDLVSGSTYIETSYRKVIINSFNLDSRPVRVNISLLSPSLNVEFSAKLTSSIIFDNVPASIDYYLQVLWINDSIILCPLLNKTITLVINASVNITIIAYLHDLNIHVMTVDGDPLQDINITLSGYIDNSCIFLLNTSISISHVFICNLPVGKDVNITYDLSASKNIFSVLVQNSTTFTLNINELTSSITLHLPVSKIIVETIDIKNNTVSAALVFLLKNNSIIDTKVTNSSGLTEFRNLPLGNYTLYAEFGEYRSNNITVSLKKAIIVSIRIKVVIGALRCAIVPRKTFYEARWGSTITIEVEFWDIDANMRISADSVNITIVDPNTNTQIVKTQMNESDTIGVYYAIVHIDERFTPVRDYIAVITARKTGYEPPQPQNITIRVLKAHATLTLSTTSLIVYWQDFANITAKYIALEPEKILIHGATVNASLICMETNETITLPNLITINETSDGYEISVNTLLLQQPGDYILKVIASKENYEPQEAEAIIRVIKRETFPIVSSTDIDLVWGNISKITITLLDIENRTPMTCFQWDLRVFKNGEETEEKFGLKLEVENDDYVLIINTYEMEVAEYKLLINFTHKVYKPTLVTIRITVRRMMIQLALNAPDKILKDPLLGYAETEIEISARNLLLGGKLIENGYIEVLVTTLTGDIINRVLAKYSDGIYKARIIWTGIEPDTYKLIVDFIAFNVSGTLIPTELRANIVGDKEKTIIVDYWGGTVVIAGRKISLVSFILLIAFAFGVFAILLRKLLWILKYPPEAREIMQIIKSIKKGEIPEIITDRRAEIAELVRFRLGVEAEKEE